MPEAAGTLADLTNWVRNLIANPQPLAADHFFQSRVTHTPGGVANMDPALAGGFEPDTSPAQAVQASDLPPDVKAQLMKQWGGAGKGFIRVPPGTIDPAKPRSDVMRHEQLHALQQSAGLKKYAPEIAGRVDPSILTMLKTTPTYEKEMQTFGPDQTLADEGTAFDLISLANRAGGSSKDLKSYISGLLGPEQKREFEKLTTR